jgi:hypothetical protein
MLANRKLSTGDVEQIPPYVKPVGKVTHAVEQAVEMAVQKTVQTIPKVVDRVAHPLGHKVAEHHDAPTTGPVSNGQPGPVEDRVAKPADESHPTPG